jgi:hypothetical protein
MSDITSTDTSSVAFVDALECTSSNAPVDMPVIVADNTAAEASDNTTPVSTPGDQSHTSIVVICIGNSQLDLIPVPAGADFRETVSAHFATSHKDLFMGLVAEGSTLGTQHGCIALVDRGVAGEIPIGTTLEIWATSNTEMRGWMGVYHELTTARVGIAKITPIDQRELIDQNQALFNRVTELETENESLREKLKDTKMMLASFKKLSALHAADCRSLESQNAALQQRIEREVIGRAALGAEIVELKCRETASPLTQKIRVNPCAHTNLTGAMLTAPAVSMLASTRNAPVAGLAACFAELAEAVQRRTLNQSVVS